MGVSNLLMLSFGIPVIYSSAFAFLLFERVNGWIGPITKDLVPRLGVPEDKYPVMVLLFSIFLWWATFVLSSLVAAWNRSKPWDNTTTRDVEEKKSGLRYDAL